MQMGDMLRIILVLAGIVLFCVTISSLAQRKMTESFCLAWGFVSIILILFGILIRPYKLNQLISGPGLTLIVIIGFFVIYGAMFFSIKVSELTRKNQELAIQVTLLNEESRVAKKEIEELKKNLKNN